MIIKKLELKNFRSYKEEEIEFPLGKILFEGDVGSGKSSILYAIEFALFGLGEMSGDMLMRVGEDETSVKLIFDVNGKEYSVFRSLVRKDKKIMQKEGWILYDGNKHILSSTEMRKKILDILNFKESVKTKSSSFIYRYAVFTPQEEMKEILKMRSEDRLQTLRKAFGIEDYKIAKENAKLVLDEIKSKIKFLEGEIADLEKILIEKEEKRKKIENIKLEIEKLENQRKLVSERLEEIKSEIESLDKIYKEISKIEVQIPLLEKEIKEKRSLIIEKENENKRLSEEIISIEKELEEGRNIEVINISEDELREKIFENMRNKEEAIKKISEIRLIIKNFENLLEKGICPTCGRVVDPEEFKEKIISEKKREEEISKEYEKIKEDERILNELREKLIQYERISKRLEDLERRMKENKEKIYLNEIKISETEKAIKELEKDIQEKRTILEKNKELQIKLEEKNKEKASIEKHLEDIISQISSLKGNLKTLEEIINEIERQINEKIRKKEEKEKLEEYVIWIQEFFIPAVDAIEKNVLLTINYEFNELFQKFFYMLMEESDIRVRIDESFSPIVEQFGYEIGIDSLSGGEKTSLALAYRLALNLMVRKVCISMKNNILILDEPTDGFSKDQIFKMREVLNNIDLSQIIIVSHEKELESFVDKIFYVEKIGNVSHIREGP